MKSEINRFLRVTDDDVHHYYQLNITKRCSFLDITKSYKVDQHFLGQPFFSFSVCQVLHDYTDDQGRPAALLAEDVWTFIQVNANALDDAMDYSRDFGVLP
jgi:hypothetical protein